MTAPVKPGTPCQCAAEPRCGVHKGTGACGNDADRMVEVTVPTTTAGGIPCEHDMVVPMCSACADYHERGPVKRGTRCECQRWHEVANAHDGHRLCPREAVRTVTVRQPVSIAPYFDMGPPAPARQVAMCEACAAYHEARQKELQANVKPGTRCACPARYNSECPGDHLDNDGRLPCCHAAVRMVTVPVSFCNCGITIEVPDSDDHQSDCSSKVGIPLPMCAACADYHESRQGKCPACGRPVPLCICEPVESRQVAR